MRNLKLCEFEYIASFNFRVEGNWERVTRRAQWRGVCQ